MPRYISMAVANDALRWSVDLVKRISVFHPTVVMQSTKTLGQMISFAIIDAAFTLRSIDNC